MRDRLLLIGSALLITVVGVGSFLLADAYHVRLAWVMSFWFCFAFIAVLGWNVRDQFRSRSFIAFFCLWTVIHVVLMLALWKFVNLIYWFPLIFVELVVGFMLANRFFGVSFRRRP